MGKLFLVLIATGTALHVGAKDKTGLDIKKLHGKVAAVTEADSSCPKLVHYGCILRVAVPVEYETDHTKHTTDEHGNQVICMYYNKMGRLIKQGFSHYNDRNYKTEYIEQDGAGKVTARIVYQYDAQEHLAEVDYYNSKDSLYSKIDYGKEAFNNRNVYRFDEHGELIDHDMYSKNDVNDPIDFSKVHTQLFATPQDFIYDSPAYQTLATTYNSDKTIKRLLKHRLTYDKDSTVTGEIVYCYEHFDTYGNWHKLVYWNVTDDNTLMEPRIFILNRDIAYYP